MAKTPQRRGEVMLTAFDVNGTVAISETLSYDDYYEELHPLIDDDDFRARSGVRRLTGQVYDSSGQLQSDFETIYDEKGALIKSKTMHADGTVIER